MKPCHSSLSHFKLVSNGKNLKLLKSLSKSEATGIDQISGNVLKIATYAISPSLTYIFKLNAIVSSSFFPDDWKIARVFLLLKIRPKTAPDNYRPISILPVITKVTEKNVSTSRLLVSKLITAGDFSSKPGTLLWTRTLGTIISFFQKPTKASRA